MAATIYSVVISGSPVQIGMPSNRFTYTGNTSGEFSTYNDSLCAIYAGAVGANPNTVYNQYVPNNPGASDITAFQPGRSYIVYAKNTFNLGISGSREQAIPDKRYIHAYTPGVGGSEYNTVGFDKDVTTTPLSASFSNPNFNGTVLANYDANFRASPRIWSKAVQFLADANPNQLNNPGYIFYVFPLSSYTVISNAVTFMSAGRTPGFLQTDNKDYQNDPVFLITESGQYLRLA